MTTLLLVLGAWAVGIVLTLFVLSFMAGLRGDLVSVEDGGNILLISILWPISIPFLLVIVIVWWLFFSVGYLAAKMFNLGRTLSGEDE